MTSPSLPPALAQLAQTITRLQNRIAQVERNQRTAQLGSTSIEGGNLTVNDPSGNPAVVVGLQSDGSVTAHTIGSFLPPQTPSTPQALPGVLSVWVVWDGSMTGATAPLLDFQCVQIHCSTTPGFTPSAATLAGTMPSAGLFTVGQLTGSTTYYVALVAVNDAGVTGTPSGQASAVAGTVAANITAGSVTAELLAAGIVVAGIVDATTITGATVIADGTSGQYLLYQGAPANGNLIGSWTTSPGIDPEGNPFIGGLSAGGPGGAQVQLIPDSGTGAASLALPSNAGDEATVPSVSGGTFNPAAAAAQPYVAISGPANSNDAALASYTLAITAASDDGTIPAGVALTDAYGNDYLVLVAPGGVPELGIGAGFTGTGMPVAGTAVQAFLNGSLVTYGTSAGGQVTERFTASQPWICPAGVTTLAKVELWGPGGGGGGGSAPGGLGNGGAGGGGGAYTVATAVPSTALKSYTLTVGSGGSGGNAGVPNGSPGANGVAGSGPTTFNADGGTLSAGAGGYGTGGHNGHVGGAGGTGTRNGGAGGVAATDGTDTGGAGGGGSGGPTTGGSGGVGTGSRNPGGGGPGNPGGSGGGYGGGGGWGSSSNNGNAGGSGAAPGGGGAGGGGGTDAHTYRGGNGADGMVQITYTAPGTAGILASMASGLGAGTDPSGNTVPAGFMGQIVAVHPGSSPSVPETPQSLPLVTATWAVRTGGTYLGQYYLTADGRLQIDFELQNTSGLAGGNYAITTALPAGYRPTHTQDQPMTGGPSSAIGISTGGVLTAYTLPANGGTTIIQFSGSFSGPFA